MLLLIYFCNAVAAGCYQWWHLLLACIYSITVYEEPVKTACMSKSSCCAILCPWQHLDFKASS